MEIKTSAQALYAYVIFRIINAPEDKNIQEHI